MNADSPKDVGVEELEVEWGRDAKRWRLPPRKLGPWRRLGWLGLVPFLASLPFLFGFSRFADAVLRGGANGGNNGPQQWIFLLFLVPFLVAILVSGYFAIRILTAGICILREQSLTEVEQSESTLTVIERFYWVRFKRRFKGVDGIRYLKVVSAEELKRLPKTNRHSKDYSSLGLPVPLENKFALVANTPGNQNFIIAVVYPRPILEQLQARMEAALGLAKTAGTDHRSSLNVAGVDASNADEPEERAENLSEKEWLVERPADSKIQSERREDGITLSIPKLGLMRGSHGLFFFAVIWNLFVLFFILMLILAAMGVVKADGNTSTVGAILGIGFFQLIGIGLLIGSLYMGTRRSTVATSYGMLLISTQSIFGKRVKQWESEQIDTIDFGPSGMEVNDVPVMQLQVHEVSGKKYGTLTQLSNSELEWIAFELRQSLSLRPSRPIPMDNESIKELAKIDDTGSVILPEGSRLKVESMGGDWSIHAPSRIESQSIFGAAIGLVFASIGVIVPVFVFGGGKWDIGMILFFLVWSGGFVSIGLFALFYNLGTMFSQYEIVCRFPKLSVRRIRPWGTLSKEFSLENLLDMKIVPLMVQQGGDQSKVKLVLGGTGSNAIHILPHWPARDIAYVMAKIEHSNRVANSMV